MDWRSKAACLSVDPELFFPIGNTGPAIAQAAEAKAVCRECAVQAICLQWALDNNQDSGVWGGMSARGLSCFLPAHLCGGGTGPVPTTTHF